MASKYEQFDRERLKIESLSSRRHLVDLDSVLQIGEAPMEFTHPSLGPLADAIAAAKVTGSAVILMMGAHVIKQGLSRYVCDLIRRRLVSAVAVNGAGPIHDFELARIGATSESVPENIPDGRFGMWAETAQINDIIRAGRAEGLGLGEAIGKFISESDFPHKDVSILAAGYESSVPVTVHVGIGYDIIHEHPNCDGAATGECSYRDFLIFTKVAENLQGGVLMCYGSAVMGPEVYLKALSMARNVARQDGQEIRQITSAVFDLIDLGDDLSAEAPKDSPEYYYRPFKTVLVRTVRDGGFSHYIRGDHRATLPALHKLIIERTGA